jgi:hypothetical protein
LPASSHQFVDGVDGGLHLVVAEHHGAQHDFFGQLLASDSTISTAASVPATTRSSWLSCSWVWSG